MGIGKKNIVFGWVWILVGILIGAVMGMWSFNGPLPSPVGEYADLPRRLLRLSHIAFIALAMVNILYGYEIDKVFLKEKTKRIGSLAMVWGGVLMPLFLLAAVFYEPFKYLTMISAILIILAVSIMAIGQIRERTINRNL